MTKPTDVERTEELFAFLQGDAPDGYQIESPDMPRLSPKQAWTVIWYLGNQDWQVTDHIEWCQTCGDIFDTNSGGTCLDYGKPPYHFCDGCEDGPEANRKRACKRKAVKKGSK